MENKYNETNYFDGTKCVGQHTGDIRKKDIDKLITRYKKDGGTLNHKSNKVMGMSTYLVKGTKIVRIANHWGGFASVMGTLNSTVHDAHYFNKKSKFDYVIAEADFSDFEKGDY